MSSRDSFDTLSPEFRIDIDGTEVPEKFRADLVSIRVLEEVHATGMFAIAVHCWDTVEMKVKWIDESLLDAGRTVTIYMGYRDHMEKLFTGEISGLEPEFNTASAPVLTIRGYDRGHRLMRHRKTRSFLQMKDSDIAQQLASQAGLSADVQSTGPTLDYVLQHNQTDLEFLQQRAARIGFEIFVTESKLFFRKRPTNAHADITLRREVELLEFYPRSATLNQVHETKVLAWNPKEKKALVGKSNAGAVDSMAAHSGPKIVGEKFNQPIGPSVRMPVSSQAEADDLARGMLSEMALNHVTGDGVCIGNKDLRPGKAICIDGIGRRFSGSYYVTSTEHTYLPMRGYRTHFTVRRNATG